MEKKTLNKSQRLKSRTDIQTLFKKGRKIKGDQVLLFYLEVDNIPQNQFMFSVSKRIFKSAVKRNRVKRLLREAVRHQQYHISLIGEKKYHLAFIYLHQEICDIEVFHKNIEELFEKLHEKNKAK